MIKCNAQYKPKIISVIFVSVFIIPIIQLLFGVISYFGFYLSYYSVLFLVIFIFVLLIQYEASVADRSYCIFLADI